MSRSPSPGSVTPREAAGARTSGAPLRCCDVCIVTYNSEDSISRLLFSLARDPVVATIYLLDNASTDNTLAVVRAEAARLQLTVSIEQSRTNLGFPRGCNRLLSRTRAAVVAMVNPDVELTKNALTALTTTALADSSIGIVSCRLVTRDGRPQSEAARGRLRLRRLVASCIVPPRLARAVRDSRWNVRRAGENRTGVSRVVSWFGARPASTLVEDLDVECTIGALMVFRRELLWRVGYFDDSVFMYLEDLDFCERVRRAGLRIRYLGTTTVWHDSGTSARGSHARLYALLPQVWLTYLRRYGAPRERVLARPVLAAVCGIDALKRLAHGESPRGELLAVWYALTYRPRSKPRWS